MSTRPTNDHLDGRTGLPGADRFTRLGGWLFRHRTALPLPIVVALLVLPAESSSTELIWLGVIVVVAAELIRLSAVRYIGAVSRTRSKRLGRLVSEGPFAYVRNPLYLANIALWAGFAVSAQLPVAAPVIAVALAIEYAAIVRWEESLLISQLGDVYRAYLSRVPRWLPSFRFVRHVVTDAPAFSWRDTLFSERGTLITIAVGYLALWLKSELWK
jgi:protein-S-isoprenylcysteine O-methyltransferase Ste14